MKDKACPFVVVEDKRWRALWEGGERHEAALVPYSAGGVRRGRRMSSVPTKSVSRILDLKRVPLGTVATRPLDDVSRRLGWQGNIITRKMVYDPYGQYGSL